MDVPAVSGVAVRLTWRELAIAADVGCNRRIRSLAHGRRDKFDDGNAWAREVQAAAAEMAVGKATDRYWGGDVDTFKLPDVAGLQVRHTARDDGCLIVYPDDADHEVFVLVVGRPPLLTVIGGIKGHEAKRPEWLREPPLSLYPAFFVPQSALGPIFT